MTVTKNPGLRNSLQKYVLVGVIATAVDWIIFSILIFAMDFHYLFAGVFSFLVATLAGYWSGLKLLFQHGRYRRWVEMTFIYVTSALGFVLHAGALLLLAGWLEMHWFLAKVVATAATFFWNFSARYYWIFSRSTLDA